MFIDSNKLKRQYAAKGRFYQIGYQNGKNALCRSCLDIFSRNLDIDNQSPDAFIIMQNPGDSVSLEAIDNSFDGPIYRRTHPRLDQLIRQTPITMAKPDKTQYQVMRLMHHYGWNYARVLNLGDLRDTVSDSFIKKFLIINDRYLSIFSGVRNTELFNLIHTIDSKPTVVAWGVDRRLKSLAIQALGALPDHICGLSGDHEHLFYHPLPRKNEGPRKWLERFISEITYS
ncbi:hypothetical protein [Paenibacillus montanisoli]|uniref:DUF1643 domain-containing protein n=1 Tax=Paenibacillus montanisoli TaxID=2081970 RepID=A0A328TV19_9BACL|nr:hypothetical protein [Paenibacillus montanisoli]RAP74378.1 hypothetical protein DL346_20060 [Paenibacillus montanisoli]